MNKSKNDLLVFLAGIALLVVGLFLFCHRVEVSSNWGFGWRIGNFPIGGGLIVVPFIIGIVWMFATSSMASKVFTGFSVLLIIAGVIASTRIYVTRMPLYEWILILVMIFAGLGLVLRTVLAGKKSEKEENTSSTTSTKASSTSNIDDELEKMKNNK